MDEQPGDPDELIVYHPLQYTTVVTYDAEHDEYMASCKEIPTIQAFGKTHTEALVNFIKLTLGLGDRN